MSSWQTFPEWQDLLIPGDLQQKQKCNFVHTKTQMFYWFFFFWQLSCMLLSHKINYNVSNYYMAKKKMGITNIKKPQQSNKKSTGTLHLYLLAWSSCSWHEMLFSSPFLTIIVLLWVKWSNAKWSTGCIWNCELLPPWMQQNSDNAAVTRFWLIFELWGRCCLVLWLVTDKQLINGYLYPCRTEQLSTTMRVDRAPTMKSISFKNIKE